MDLTYIAIFLIVLGAIIMGSKLLTLLASSAAGTVTLQDSIAEVEFQHIAANYGGAGNFVNEIAAPHSGAAQGDYDFVPQVTQPTFDTNKFTMSGANYWQIAANNAWLTALHKNAGTTDFTFCAIVKIATTGFFTLMGTGDFSGDGVQWQPNLNPLDLYYAHHLGGSRILNLGTADDAFTTGSTHFIAVSVDGASQEVRHYMEAIETVKAYTNTSTTTNAPSFPLTLGAEALGAVAEIMPVGTEVYAVAGINKALNATEIATARAFLEAQAGI